MTEKEPLKFKQGKIPFMLYEDLNGITHIERDYRVVNKTPDGVNRAVNPLLDITVFQKKERNDKH